MLNIRRKLLAFLSEVVVSSSDLDGVLDFGKAQDGFALKLKEFNRHGFLVNSGEWLSGFVMIFTRSFSEK